MESSCQSTCDPVGKLIFSITTPSRVVGASIVYCIFGDEKNLITNHFISLIYRKYKKYSYVMKNMTPTQLYPQSERVHLILNVRGARAATKRRILDVNRG